MAFSGQGEAGSIVLESVPFLEASSRSPPASFFLAPACGESPGSPCGRRRCVDVVPSLEASSGVHGGVDGAFLLAEGNVAAACSMLFIFSTRSSSSGGDLQLASGCVVAQVVVRSWEPSGGGALLSHARATSRIVHSALRVSTLPSDGSAPFEPGQEDSGLLRR